MREFGFRVMRLLSYILSPSLAQRFDLYTSEVTKGYQLISQKVWVARSLVVCLFFLLIVCISDTSLRQQILYVPLVFPAIGFLVCTLVYINRIDKDISEFEILLFQEDIEANASVSGSRLHVIMGRYQSSAMKKTSRFSGGILQCITRAIHRTSDEVGITVIRRKKLLSPLQYEFYPIDKVLNDVIFDGKVFSGYEKKEVISLFYVEELTGIDPRSPYAKIIDINNIPSNPFIIERYKNDDAVVLWWANLFLPYPVSDRSRIVPEFFRLIMANELYVMYQKNLRGSNAEVEFIDFSDGMPKNSDIYYIPSFILEEMINVASFHSGSEYKDLIASWVLLRTGKSKSHLHSHSYHFRASECLLTVASCEFTFRRSFWNNDLIPMTEVSRLCARVVSLLGIEPSNCSSTQKEGYQALMGTAQALKVFPRDSRLFLGRDMGI